jgi:signal transduction histidine kinase
VSRKPLSARNARSCYFARPSNVHDPVIIDVVEDAIRSSGIISISNELLHVDDTPGALSKIAKADFLIAEISRKDPNVFYELGIAQSMGKPSICLVEDNSIRNINFDISSYDFNNAIFINYNSKEYKSLYNELLSTIKKIQASPIGRQSRSAQVRLPFFIDWDLLDPREIENLCQELLVQMGFRKVQWRESIREVDLIAEFPRKDPDGFEFRELWLIALGQRTEPRRTLEMAMHDPSYLIHRISTYSRKLSQLAEDKPVSLLVISMSDDDLSSFEARSERRGPRSEMQNQLRIRVWDKPYMTSLVQRYPNIAYKYFSEEGRYQSKFRKSFEELYKENESLVSRQRSLIVELKSEKDKRVRAERDAVWKDISFAAAHKIGNPIFAIETGLDPLLKRMNEGRIDEASEIATIIGRAVNKAKTVVEQFKSLAKSQQLHLTDTSVLSVIGDIAESLKSQGIAVQLEVSPTLYVRCDVEKIEECFDELAMNSMRWLEKSGKKRPEWRIEITAATSANRELPDSLEIGKKYVVVNFRDNGTGVPIDKKNKIFDAFVTDYEHGTGLGLALVRRVVEGHGGAIVEVGKPGEGADFEIYLPLAIAPSEDDNLKVEV